MILTETAGQGETGEVISVLAMITSPGRGDMNLIRIAQRGLVDVRIEYPVWLEELAVIN